jgi:6-pyruvoyltetrahydropterin/6-carboxytetrahydropterin synthase
MWTISKEFAFEAQHRLAGLPEGHKCGRWHGHSYRVVVEISGRTDPIGFVLDYGELDPVKRWIDTHLDHRSLNDVDGFPSGFNPTAENVAYEIAVLLVQLVPALGEMRDAANVRWRVGVSETAKTWAWCDPWEPWPPDPQQLDLASIGITEHELLRYYGLDVPTGPPMSGLTSVQLQPPEPS